MNKVITRFPPSPTGKFHIGSARTALFNYLFAKKNGGEFILRFEDTDQDRSTIESEEDIKSGLKWLGLNWDGSISHQLSNIEKHVLLAERLIKEDLAYEKEGAIWFKIPEDKEIVINDLIRGEVKFNTKEFNDFVIIRSSGIPIYYFSNAIDDFDDKVTHVLRGEEHITNTPKQILICNALGFKTPEYGHMPLILNEDRTKLSKRSGSTSVTDYKEGGYLPEALINFLALMGWNPGDEREFFSLEDLAKEFDIDRVQKSPAVFNVEKLNSINSHYINLKSDRELSSNLGLDEKLIKISKSRAKTLLELKSLSEELINYNDKYNPVMLIFKKSDKEKTIAGLESTVDSLQQIDEKDWGNTDKLNEVLLGVVEKENLDNGSVFWPVRYALSGLDKSPSPVELLWALGKEESLKRVEAAIKKLK